MSQFEIMAKKQEELENLQRYLRNKGLTDEKIKMISEGNTENNKKKIVDRCIVTLEIIVDKDIAKKYPNFIFNYENEKDFLINQVANLNQYITLEECNVFLNLHPQHDNPDYEIEDFGYKQIVKKVQFNNYHFLKKIILLNLKKNLNHLAVVKIIHGTVIKEKLKKLERII